MMNYVREELLRQRAALAALMAGGIEEEAVERTTEVLAAEAETQLPGAMEPENAVLAGTVQRWRRVASGLYRKSAYAAENPVTQADRKDLLSGGWERDSGVGSFHEADSQTHMTSAMSPAVVPGVTVDAREVSRVIQRDARRYDGGFSIY